MDVQCGSDAPRLRNGSARSVGRVGVVQLADRADAVTLDVLVEVFQRLLGLRQECVAVDVEAGLDVEGQQPWPYRAVFGGEVAFGGHALLRTPVKRVLGRQRPQSLRGEQVLAHRADHLQLHRLVEHLVIQSAGDDHVGARRFVGTAAVHEVGQIAFRQAEQFDERLLRACRKRGPLLDEGLVRLVPVFAGQFERIAYGVVPQGVHFDLIAVARGHGASVDRRIHPRQGHLFR